MTAPIARALGVKNLIAVQLQRDDNGWITGEIDGIPSMRWSVPAFPFRGKARRPGMSPPNTAS